MPKKTERGTLWSRSVMYVTRETFLVQFLGRTVAIWRLLKFFQFRCIEKKPTKSHDYSRLLRKAPTKNENANSGILDVTLSSSQMRDLSQNVGKLLQKPKSRRQQHKT